MAWQTGAGGRAFRKEASAAKRSDENRKALDEPELKHRRKRPSNRACKYGLEYALKKHLTLNWLPHYSWYETEKKRDQAYEALIRKDKFFTYRKVERP